MSQLLEAARAAYALGGAKAFLEFVVLVDEPIVCLPCGGHGWDTKGGPSVRDWRRCDFCDGIGVVHMFRAEQKLAAVTRLDALIQRERGR